MTRHLLGLALCLLPWLHAQAGNNCVNHASLTNPLSSTLVLQKPGLGGTGMVAAAPGLGGTGIVGIITGFASICVNGVEVHYSEQTPVSTNGLPGHAGALAVGQVVVVNASGSGDEVQARQISLMHAAIGPVQGIQASQGQFNLLGQTIQTDLQLTRLSVGQWVRVSGQRNAEGTLQATHIEAVAPQTQAQLAGTLQQSPDGTWTLNGTPVNTTSRVALQAGSEALLKGQWTGAHLQIEHHVPEPTRRQLGAVTHLVVEGYVRAQSAKSITLDHHVMALDTPGTEGVASTKFSHNQRVRITASVRDGQSIHVEHIESAKSSGGSTSVQQNPSAIEQKSAKESENKPEKSPENRPVQNNPAVSVRSEPASRGSGESGRSSGEGKSSSGSSSSSSSGKSGKSDSGKH